MDGMEAGRYDSLGDTESGTQTLPHSGAPVNGQVMMEELWEVC